MVKKKWHFKPMPNLSETLFLCWVEFGNKTQLQPKAITPFNIFVLDVNFGKFIIVLHFLLISSIAKIPKKKKINNYHQFNV